MKVIKRACENCSAYDKINDQCGFCRKHPGVIFENSDTFNAIWPVVGAKAWCCEIVYTDKALRGDGAFEEDGSDNTSVGSRRDAGYGEGGQL